MKPTIYLETSVLSYLTGRPSRDIVNAARQQITSEWWTTKRSEYSIYASQPVLHEASSGDPDAVSKRLEILHKIPLLELSTEIRPLTEVFIRETPFPPKAEVDALHIAIACIHQMDFLLSWNFKHIANAFIRSKLEVLAESQSYKLPTICTPEELLF